MDFSIWHTAFDVIMGVVLLHWMGRKLADLSRRDTIAVVWECLISQWRRSHSPSETEQSADLTSAQWKTEGWDSTKRGTPMGYPAGS
jgi:hypothetical protein